MSVDIYSSNAQDKLSLDELTLYHQIMEYRGEQGLSSIPLSKALTTTAGRHVVDTRENIWGENVSLPDGANLHSWSDAYYYADGSAPEAMWEAPQRLETGYETAGYEITGAGYADSAAALEGWKDSDAHNDILTNQDSWADVEYNAIGIGLDTSSGPGVYAGRIFHVWFGTSTDDTGVPTIAGTSGDDEVRGTNFADLIQGGDGADTISGGNGKDSLYGGDGADTLAGGNGSDRLSGGTGDDRLLGKSGNDLLYGGAGDDSLSGASGSDTLVGGSGADTLIGGDGADVFRFGALSDSPSSATRDRITDFQAAIDRIDLSLLDADTGQSGNQAFDYIGSDRFSGTAGELRLSQDLVRADVDGDGSPDFQFRLDNSDQVTAGDFIL